MIEHRSLPDEVAGRRRRRSLAWLTVASTALALLVAPGCEQKNTFKPPPPAQVTVAHPVELPVVDSMQFTGTTRATTVVDLRARVNWYLEKVSFEDGANVEKGQLLFRIEQAPYLAALDAAEANQQKMQAALQLAQAQFARTTELANQRVVPQSDLDIQRAELGTARANIAAAKAAVTRAQLDLSYTQIRAPTSGRIGRHLVDVGNLVQAEDTLLARIESLNPIHAYFFVSESDLLRFMKMLREHKLPDPEKIPPKLYLGLANEPGYPHEGHLDFRELGIDPSTGTVMRRAIFPNPNNTLIPGLFVRIYAPLGEPVPQLLVEERALGSDQRGDFVLVVNDKQVVEYRPVRLGTSVGNLRVVEGGIGKNDWVVVNGLQRARPGAKVDPQPAAVSAKVDTGPAQAQPTADQRRASARAVPRGQRTY